MTEAGSLAALRRRIAAALANGAPPEDLRATLEAEIAASESRAPRKPKPGPVSVFLRHPAALLVLGTLVAGTLGTAIGQLWEARAARAAERRAAEAQLRDIQVMAETLRIRAAFLRSGLVSDLPEAQLAARRAAWDAAYVTWQTRWRAEVSALDSFFGWSQDSPLALALEAGAASLAYEMDDCLTRAHAARTAAPEDGAPSDRATAAAAALADCHRPSFDRNESRWKGEDPTENAVDRFRDCVREAAAGLRQFAARDLHCRSRAWTEPRCPNHAEDCAPEARRTGAMFTARAMVGSCWGDPEKTDGMTSRAVAAGYDPAKREVYDRLCWIDDSLWNRLTGLVRWDAGP